MKVLLLGSGGRESALAWALDRSPSVSQLFVGPGNPGIGEFADLVDLETTDRAAVVREAHRLGADLVVVGPEAPLVAGVGDALRDTGIDVFGPSALAARVEGSKTFAKELMERGGVPTGAWRAFTDPAQAIAYLDELGPPYVIKADGLAAGKGVVVTEDRAAAIDALEERLVRGAFGTAGERIVIEEFLDGQEASLIAFSDGRSVALCEPAQDYKRVNDGDDGPNTGGMGSYSPVPACPPELAQQIAEEVIAPAIATTAEMGAPFVGALYAGLALTSKGPKVVEFNARFGDPETQALLPRLDGDLGEITRACARGELEGARVAWSDRASVTVVLASGGYPGPHETGFAIEGLGAAAATPDTFLFHAGTARRGNDVITSGGRVLAVTALGDTFSDARRRAYEAAGKITFENKHLRTDIALRAEEQEGR